ncbi:Stk1 family PASTA domain-containing Ser/Thr kinase [soil metagenome]
MTQDAPNPLLGREIAGKYRIVRLLGEGGMGAVYLGEQKLGSTLRKVAIKTLHPHLSHDQKILARFEREVGTVAGLQHPNTIQVFDFGKMDDGTLYIVMEFVEGRSVADVLEKDGPMEPERVQRILAQVCGSLEEAHQQGIVHRDLKPDNVVLCDKAGQKDWVEVLDFGIAQRSTEEDKQEQKLTQQGMVLGTPPYMSPEQFTGKPIDKRSDIYSLGVMAYEMLTGTLPFSGNTAWEWATAHMTAQPAPIDTLPIGGRIPPAMKHAISRAMEKDPNARWSTVTEFFQAFSGAGGAGHVSAPMAIPPRARTEVGTPMPGAAYGASPYPTPSHGSPAPYPTPAQGGQAYTPGPMPQVPAGPAHEGRRRGGGNGVLIAFIALGLLVAIGGVVGYLVTQSGGGGTASTGTTTGTGSPTVALTTPTASATDTRPVDTAQPLASLKGTTTQPYVPPTGVGTKPTATGSVKPPPSGTVTATATASTKPTATATVTSTTPTATATATTNEPKECQAAKLRRSLGRTNEAETRRNKCVEKGGKDPFP